MIKRDEDTGRIIHIQCSTPTDITYNGLIEFKMVGCAYRYVCAMCHEIISGAEINALLEAEA